MGGESTTQKVMGPLQIAAGAGLSIVPGGQAIGIPLLMSGLGETIGGAAGGSKGFNIGGLAGGAAGGIGEGFGGMGPLGGFLGGLGQGGGLGTGGAFAPAASQSSQLANLAKAGFPGAQQMAGAGGASPGLGSQLLSSPLVGQLAGGMMNQQQPQMTPPSPRITPPGPATPPQVQVPQPPPPPNFAGAGNPLAMLMQMLSKGAMG